MTYTGKLYGRLGGVFVNTGYHTSDIDELTSTVKRLEADNRKIHNEYIEVSHDLAARYITEVDALRKAIIALMPFLMEDYVVGVMTDDYRAAIELAIEANKTEAQHAS
jgi:uncharacterized protein Smg (DUF494 family)